MQFPFSTLLMSKEELMGEVYRFLTVSDLIVMAGISKDLAKYRKVYAKTHMTNAQLMTILKNTAEYVGLPFFLEKIAYYLRYKLESRSSEIPASLSPEVIRKLHPLLIGGIFVVTFPAIHP